MAKVGKDLKDHLVPSSAMVGSANHQICPPQAVQDPIQCLQEQGIA